ncbi:uncharacterized protein STEHIDRAFT_109015 [Stereum hirsutum FP-91666 SS1]|uniref:uncharacterized protein n=1 Tax=Stereum hirsutum (strain FP-91666) TaxID=721885 RepID=UPI000440BA42|nr:uncharacterized protein STEHIDRAFT_109015 [Stereum hirsutum FP-91666 SS1]EIM90544.1 hypothetical protein STEHIDRAFT_109015 [Stereum hirsutum FP-91666 SS1]
MLVRNPNGPPEGHAIPPRISPQILEQVVTGRRGGPRLARETRSGRTREMVSPQELAEGTTDTPGGREREREGTDGESQRRLGQVMRAVGGTHHRCTNEESHDRATGAADGSYELGGGENVVVAVERDSNRASRWPLRDEVMREESPSEGAERRMSEGDEASELGEGDDGTTVKVVAVRKDDGDDVQRALLDGRLNGTRHRWRLTSSSSSCPIAKALRLRQRRWCGARRTACDARYALSNTLTAPKRDASSTASTVDVDVVLAQLEDVEHGQGKVVPLAVPEGRRCRSRRREFWEQRSSSVRRAQLRQRIQR